MPFGAAIHFLTIPSSMEHISHCCFVGCWSLSSLTFEPCARISVLGDGVFPGWESLESLSIPASVRELSGLLFHDSWIWNVTVERRNRFLGVSGDFLVTFQESCLVRYLAMESDLVISKDIQPISAGCFNRCDGMASLIFEPGCRISNLSQCAFANCQRLESICIPSSVETIGRCCFTACWSLSSLAFECGCKVSILGEYTFANCWSLQSIWIPSSIQQISADCFAHCKDLASVEFESGCRVSILGEAAFADCWSLQSICIPSSVRTVSKHCFRSCTRLSTFMIEAGSTLRIVDKSVFADCHSLEWTSKLRYHVCNVC
jgi:hypothetical protein